jgi:hypothetical protein
MKQGRYELFATIKVGFWRDDDCSAGVAGGLKMNKDGWLIFGMNNKRGVLFAPDCGSPLKPGDGVLESLFKVHAWLPTEQLFGAGDVGLANLQIVFKPAPL